MLITRSSLLLLAACCLSACGGSSDSSSQTAKVGPLGVVEDRSPGLIGTDANSNGIRDDVDALIAKNYSATPAIKKMAEQNAKAIQALMVAKNKSEAAVALDAMTKATACAREIFPGNGSSETAKARYALMDQLEGLTANTKERLTAYLAGDALMGGSIIRLPTGVFCD